MDIDARPVFSPWRCLCLQLVEMPALRSTPAYRAQRANSSQSLRTINSAPEEQPRVNHGQQLTYVCFTINNPEDHGISVDDILNIPDWVKYVVFQYEEGRSGTPHFQGYAELSVRKSIGAIKNQWLGKAAHLEKLRDKRETARAYCMKEEGRIDGPWEQGEWVEGAGQGKRTDLNKAAAIVMAEGIDAVREQMPGTYIRYAQGLRAYAREIQAKPSDKDFVPKEWQQQLLDLLSEEPDDRTIYWVTDTTGNSGKSRLTKHLMLEHGAMVLNGKVADMQHGFYKRACAGKVPSIVVFDISRAAAEYSDHLYTMAENIKSGFFFSPKYDGDDCVFDSPHVVFMANRSWDRNKFSHDRVHEINLNSIGQAGNLPSFI